MSYMDVENILEEGFFDRFKKAFTKQKKVQFDFKKGCNFKCLLESHNFRKSSILEGNMEASWHQNRSRNRCYLRKAVFF